jgi:preprotein translocase subunit SecE
MRRVVWPSRDELKTYSIAIIIMLVVFGVLLWLVDSGIVAALVGFTSLRG